MDKSESKLAPCPECKCNYPLHDLDCATGRSRGAANKRSTSADSQEREAFEQWWEVEGKFMSKPKEKCFAAWRAALAAPKQPTSAESAPVHFDSNMQKVNIASAAANASTPSTHSADVSKKGAEIDISDDRSMLLAVLKDLEISSWQCPRCGHAEDCKDMDAADMLRDYFSRGAAPKPALTDEQIVQLFSDVCDIQLTSQTNEHWISKSCIVAFTRAVLAAAQGEKK